MIKREKKKCLGLKMNLVKSNFSIPLIYENSVLPYHIEPLHARIKYVYPTYHTYRYHCKYSKRYYVNGIMNRPPLM